MNHTWCQSYEHRFRKSVFSCAKAVLNSAGRSGTLNLLSLTFNVFIYISWDVISATVRHEPKRHFDISRSVTFGTVFAMVSFGPASLTNSPLSTTSRKEAKLLQHNDQKLKFYSSLLHSLYVTEFVSIYFTLKVPYLVQCNNDNKIIIYLCLILTDLAPTISTVVCLPLPTTYSSSSTTPAFSSSIRP